MQLSWSGNLGDHGAFEGRLEGRNEVGFVFGADIEIVVPLGEIFGIQDAVLARRSRRNPLYETQ